jgi:hypothetical protein
MWTFPRTVFPLRAHWLQCLSIFIKRYFWKIQNVLYAKYFYLFCTHTINSVNEHQLFKYWTNNKLFYLLQKYVICSADFFQPTSFESRTDISQNSSMGVPSNDILSLLCDNPLSDIVDIGHHSIVSFKVLGEKLFIATWISCVKSISGS